MLTSFARAVVNVVYLVNFKVKKFRKKYPNERVLAAGGSKAVCLNDDQKVTWGPKWITAKRAVLILSDKRLVCGSWDIELNQVASAQIVKLRSISGKGLVLKIKTAEGKHYQFGLQYDPRWIEQKILDVKVEDGKASFSLFSIIIRILLLIYIIRWIFHR